MLSPYDFGALWIRREREVMMSNGEGSHNVSEVPNAGWDRRIHLFRAGHEVDTYAVVTERSVVFVDTTATPEDAAMIVEAMRPHLETRLPLVVNTHADYDHAWGNAAFATPGGTCPAPIIGHRLTSERLRGGADAAYLEE